MLPPPKSQHEEGELSVLATLFSSGIVQEMARKGKSEAFCRLAHESGLATTDRKFVRDAFDYAFQVLQKHHRTEYIYKNVIAKKILFGRHSLNTAVMMTEFRVGECKADVVILNGTSTAYEIKSERDKLDRLSSQVETYLEAFARVCVVASESHLAQVLELVPHSVGVMRLTSRGSLSTLREPFEEPTRIVPSLVFEMLQLKESREILNLLGVEVPEGVPNTRLHSAQRRLFKDLSPADLHAAMVKVLKVTRNQRPLTNLLESLPLSLRSLAIATQIRKLDHERLKTALNTRMADALAWI